MQKMTANANRQIQNSIFLIKFNYKHDSIIKITVYYYKNPENCEVYPPKTTRDVL